MGATTRLSDRGRQELDALLNDAIDSKKLPALFFAVCNGDEVLYENQRGWCDYSRQDEKEVDPETVLHLYSMTKFVTAVAVHQLADEEPGMSLHDPEIVSKYLPELAKGTVEILVGLDDDRKPILKKATREITLAMLISHTAGLAYAWQPEEPYRTWVDLNPKKSVLATDATVEDYLQPLLYEPGASWRYSTGLDWAGFFVERFTGQSLEVRYREKIFGPLGMDSFSFYLNTRLADRRVMNVCAMDDSGTFIVMPQPPLKDITGGWDIQQLNGGGGLHGTTRDYVKLLQAVLRSSPQYSGTGKPIVSPESFKSMFTGVVSTQDGFAALETMLKSNWYHQPKGGYSADAVQHSPGLLLYVKGGENGREAGSGCWDGACKTTFFIDPVRGIAAECNTSVFSMRNDNAIGETIRSFERILYAGLTKP